eukprot:gene11512-biopygen1837
MWKYDARDHRDAYHHDMCDRSVVLSSYSAHATLIHASWDVAVPPTPPKDDMRVRGKYNNAAQMAKSRGSGAEGAGENVRK